MKDPIFNSPFFIAIGVAYAIELAVGILGLLGYWVHTYGAEVDRKMQRYTIAAAGLTVITFIVYICLSL